MPRWPMETPRPIDGLCSLDGCERPFSARGMCKPHYERWRRGIDVNQPIRSSWRDIPLVDRLELQSEKMPSGCIEWRGTVGAKGYGHVKQGGRSTGAYRAAYLVHVGDIPDGYEVDHLCRNRLCINPDHLEAVTKRENILRSDNPTGVNARKTHCHRGHEFTSGNTFMHPDGRRECRSCIVLRRRLATS